MRKARTPEGQRFRELLSKGPVGRDEAQAELERCVSNHRGLAKEVKQMMSRGTASPYRSSEQLVASGKKEIAFQVIRGALRSNSVKQTIDSNGKKWLSCD